MKTFFLNPFPSPKVGDGELARRLAPFTGIHIDVDTILRSLAAVPATDFDHPPEDSVVLSAAANKTGRIRLAASAIASIASIAGIAVEDVFADGYRHGP